MVGRTLNLWYKDSKSIYYAVGKCIPALWKISVIMRGIDMGKIKNGKLLYHLTKLSNLDSIIEMGLVSRRILEREQIAFDDVADPQIMSKRKEFGLDCYVPFHFHPYSSFDVAVKNTYSDEFIYICIERTLARESGFLILPKHPLSIEEVKLYSFDEGINEIDWDAMESSSTKSDHCKNVRMAECLTNNAIPVSYFQSIAVKNQDLKEFVESKLAVVGGARPYVNIQPWLNT